MWFSPILNFHMEKFQFWNSLYTYGRTLQRFFFFFIALSFKWERLGISKVSPITIKFHSFIQDFCTTQTLWWSGLITPDPARRIWTDGSELLRRTPATESSALPTCAHAESQNHHGRASVFSLQQSFQDHLLLILLRIDFGRAKVRRSPTNHARFRLRSQSRNEIEPGRRAHDRAGPAPHDHDSKRHHQNRNFRHPIGPSGETRNSDRLCRFATGFRRWGGRCGRSDRVVRWRTGPAPVGLCICRVVQILARFRVGIFSFWFGLSTSVSGLKMRGEEKERVTVRMLSTCAKFCEMQTLIQIFWETPELYKKIYC